MLYDEETTLTRRSTERLLTTEETDILIGIADRKKKERSDERLPVAAYLLSVIPLIVFGIAAYAIFTKNFILFGFILGGVFAIAGIGVSIPKPNTIGVAFALAGIWCVAILALRDLFPGTDAFILTLGLGEVFLVTGSICIGLLINRLTSKTVEAVCTGYARKAISSVSSGNFRIISYPIFMIDGKEYIPNDSGSFEDGGFDIGEKVTVRLEKDGNLIIPGRKTY